MSKQEWPVDFDSLTKDSVIEQETIEHAYAITFESNPKEYAYKLMALCEEIRKRRSDLAGHVRENNNSIRIMTDIEADDWQDKRYKDNIQSIVRIGKRRGSIDRSGFNSQRLVKSDSVDMSIASTVLTARAQQKRHNRLMEVTKSHELPSKGTTAYSDFVSNPSEAVKKHNFSSK